MKLNDIYTEEKVRLDPKCWTGKKIGNPKTKMKGGVRVNNCVPAESVEEDIDRRGFLKGLGAAAVAGATGGAKAEQLNVEPLMTSTDGSVSIVFVSRPGKAVNGWLALKKRNGQWSPQTNDPAGGIKIDGNKIITVGFDFINTDPRPGKYEPDYSLANMNGIDYIHPIKTASKQILMNLKQIGGGIVEFNPRSTKESVQQGVAEEYNPEYDDEAGMADNNLSTLRRAVDGLDDLIDAGDNLPEWCQEKIAVAKSMLVAVWDYMDSADDSEEEDPEIAEMYEAMEELAEEMARKNGVSVDRVWESFEALDDNMLYETAAWRRKEGKSKSGGLNAKGVASYRRENPGSKLQTAVTTKPSKLKPGSKAAKRRKSFCARMSGVKGPMKKPNGKPTRKALALRKWNC